MYKMNINEPSLCIPRVFGNISEDRVRTVIKKLNIGLIKRIDMILKKNDKGEDYKRVFIHFERWFTDVPDAIEARKRLLEGKEIKIVYDNPWFWKVSASKFDGNKKKNNTHNLLKIAPALPELTKKNDEIKEMKDIVIEAPNCEKDEDYEALYGDLV
jgi:hypothetical protein